MTPQNEQTITTLLSVILILPFVMYFEGFSSVLAAYQELPNQQNFMLNLFICGMCYYLYNEMQNIVLGSLGPVSTAVGNTLKRVAIFIALYIFTDGESFPPAKILGCFIAVVGCLAYAVFDAKKI